MKGYSIYLKSAIKKMKCKDSNEVSTRLIPKEKQALVITFIVASIPILITAVAMIFD